MPNTQIRGNTQIITETIENSQISLSAAIAYSKLNLADSIVNADINSAAAIATSKLADGANFILKDGSVAFTASIDAGTNKLINLVDGTLATDAVTKGQLDTAIAGVTADVDTNIVNKDEVITRETPTGTIDGTNAIFTLANTPEVGSEHVFVNGVLQEPGGTEDYTISGATITFNTAPKAAPGNPDRIRVSYLKQD